jgi:hypothetical protein
LAKVKRFGKIAERFLPTMGVLGAEPLGEGGSGKAAGFVAWEKAFPLILIHR